MPLTRYKSKRHFDLTPEPAPKKLKRPKEKRSKSKGVRRNPTVDQQERIFVIQEHHARRLHYDLRLEHDGVLKSWAVPKGPSTDPKDKRLAVQVEDHPLEYGDFEGTIPPGNYGAGTVSIWDRGEWIPHGSPAAGLRNGKLVFTLRGRRLNGDYALIRMRDDPKNWLLIKESTDRPSPGDPVRREPAAERPARRRATTTRSRPDKQMSAAGAKERLPVFIEPELATRVEAAPVGDDWIHEVKLDGYRLLARKDGKSVRLVSRNERDWTDRAELIAKEIAALKARTALLDGELVVFDEAGITRFQGLQNFAERTDRAELVYVVFDLLHLDGENLRELPLLERKRRLERLLSGRRARFVKYNPHVIGNGPATASSACRDGLEGIISKRAQSKYRSGRWKDWLKIKCDNQQEFVICGFTPHSTQRNEIGALLLCVALGGGRFTYAGKVGTGFSDAVRKDLYRVLHPLRTKAPPVTGLPRAPGAVLVRPERVAQISFREITADGLIRQGVFHGLREDKAPEEAGLEPILDISSDEPRLTHADRVLFPEIRFTKADYRSYLQAVATRMFADIARRPLSLVRCPDGVSGECFFQKHAIFQKNTKESPSDIIDVCEIPSRSGKSEKYLVIKAAEQIPALAQVSAIEIHGWNATIDDLERPDRFILDLDPDESIPPKTVIETAFLLRDLLAELDLKSFARVTGGKGVHVVVPLTPAGDWDEVKEFSKLLAEAMVASDPALYTSISSKSRRTNKIYLDYLRNGRGSTSIANYSIRARSTAPVAVPLTWEELAGMTAFDHFHPNDVVERIGESEKNQSGRSARRPKRASPVLDPWKGYDAVRQKVNQASLKAMTALLRSPLLQRGRGGDPVVRKRNKTQRKKASS